MSTLHRAWHLLLSLFLIVLLSIVGSAPQSWAAAGGTALPGLDGGELSDEELDSGPVILVFWASWSPRCRDIARRVNALERTWSPRARVVTVVFQEEAEAVREFLADAPLRAPVYLDSSGLFSKRHAVATLPALVVLRDGQTAFRGRLPENPGPVIERALSAAE